MKTCPFLNKDCLEDSCQLWIPITQEKKACALAATVAGIARLNEKLAETKQPKDHEQL